MTFGVWYFVFNVLVFHHFSGYFYEWEGDMFFLSGLSFSVLQIGWEDKLPSYACIILPLIIRAQSDIL